MVDVKGDVLMHRTLIAFFENLLKINPAQSLATSPALEFLTKTGLHRRTITYYITPDHPSHDPIDSSFLHSPAAMYTARWTETYPQDLVDPKNNPIKDAIISKLTHAMQVSPSRWAVSYSPSEDLHVLSSLPRPLLVSLGPANPILSIPCQAPNVEALNCLATLFHGPIAEPLTYPPQPRNPNTATELKAAQALYSAYLAHKPAFYSNILGHADTPAVTGPALASIALLKAIITAPWNSIPSITSGSTKATLVPWLLAQPKSFANLVGGHGDAENAAYKIAVARFDALTAFWKRIRGEEAYSDIAGVVEDRVKEGVWGRGETVGGRIATMDL